MEIEYFGQSWLRQADDTLPGTLECNCRYDTWRNRYTADGSSASEGGNCHYLRFSIRPRAGMPKEVEQTINIDHFGAIGSDFLRFWSVVEKYCF